MGGLILFFLGLMGFLTLYTLSKPPKVNAYIEGVNDIPRLQILSFEVLDDKIFIDEQYVIPMNRILYATDLADLGYSGFTRAGRYTSNRRYFLRIYYTELTGKKSSFTLTSQLNPRSIDATLHDFERIHNKINKIKGYKHRPPKKERKIEKEV